VRLSRQKKRETILSPHTTLCFVSIFFPPPSAPLSLLPLEISNFIHIFPIFLHAFPSFQFVFLPTDLCSGIYKPPLALIKEAIPPKSNDKRLHGVWRSLGFCEYVCSVYRLLQGICFFTFLAGII
jgi:hypothetical protein